jgi:hypothetical protein
MRLAVDTGAYASATDLLYDANRVVSAGVAGLAHALDDCGGMSGTDSGGREWAESYDEAARRLVRAGADLDGSLGAAAHLLDASLVNHEAADHGARLFPSPVGGGSAGPRRSGEQIAPAVPPSAYGGTGDQPDGWHWLAEHLQGLLWPDADTGRMRRAGDAWLGAAVMLERAVGSAGDASYVMEGQRSPEAPIAARAARELGSHGDDLAASCRDVATACQEYADQVDDAHAEIIGTCQELLAWTAVDQVSGAILSFVTAGGAEVAAQLVQTGVMAKYAARVIGVLRRLLELARAAAAVMSRGLARIAEILARLKVFLSLRTVRALERVGSSAAGRRALEKLSPEVREQVDEAIERAASGKVRFPKQDGKLFRNDDPTYRLPPGEYRSWTAASNQSLRGDYRVLIDGDPARPKAIYLWDHDNPPVRIAP